MVFDTVTVRYIVAFMFIFFVIQPVVPAFASEDLPVKTIEVRVQESEASPVTEEVSVSEPVSEAETAIMTEVGTETGEVFVVEDAVSEEVNSSDDQAVFSDSAESAEEASPVEEVAQEISAAPSGGGSASSDRALDEGASTGAVEGGTVVAATDLETMSKLLTTSASDTMPFAEQEVAGVATTTEVEEVFETQVVYDHSPEEVEVVIDGATTNTDTTPNPESDEESSAFHEEVLEVAYSGDSIDTATVVDHVVTLDESVASTLQGAPVVEMQSLINADNRHQFGESECVSVGDGAFYCSKATDSINTDEDGVDAEIDEEGDREIFLTVNGKRTQITDNVYEDAAPSYDRLKNEIVFHRLVEGRYQIVRYDIDTGTEEQLTESRENNMEPTQVDGVIVWQRWVGNNWEIVLWEEGVATVITDNTQHDVAPTIRDGYVMWHTTNDSGEKLLSVYDLKTGVSTTIADADGGHVENPRFVLVYDTTFENGDTVTKEYDPKTGEVKPIGSKSVPLPRQIPPPDSTGETSALVNTKTNSRDKGIAELDGETTKSTSTSTATSSPEVSSQGDATATERSIITDDFGVSAVDLSTTTSDILPLSDYDLIVEPYQQATTTDEVSTPNAATTTQSTT